MPIFVGRRGLLCFELEGLTRNKRERVRFSCLGTTQESSPRRWDCHSPSPRPAPAHARAELSGPRRGRGGPKAPPPLLLLSAGAVPAEGPHGAGSRPPAAAPTANANGRRGPLCPLLPAARRPTAAGASAHGSPRFLLANERPWPRQPSVGTTSEASRTCPGAGAGDKRRLARSGEGEGGARPE